MDPICQMIEKPRDYSYAMPFGFYATFLLICDIITDYDLLGRWYLYSLKKITAKSLSYDK